MAKIYICIEDDGKGEVDVKLDSRIPEDPKKITPAHRLAIAIMKGAEKLVAINNTTNSFFGK